MENRIALVTGANKGIGLEICRQLAKERVKVILTARNQQKGKEAAELLQEEGLNVFFHRLDVTEVESIEETARYIESKFGKLDILINNAGIRVDLSDTGLNADIGKIRQTMETNTYGPLCVCQILIPIMRKNNFGRIVNISSDMGVLSEMGSGSVGYRISKTALNAVTRILASELKDTNILVNSMSPGWVRTDMGGSTATCSIEEGADTAVWLATTDNLPTGRFFRDRKEMEW